MPAYLQTFLPFSEDHPCFPIKKPLIEVYVNFPTWIMAGKKVGSRRRPFHITQQWGLVGWACTTFPIKARHQSTGSVQMNQSTSLLWSSVSVGFVLLYIGSVSLNFTIIVVAKLSCFVLYLNFNMLLSCKQIFNIVLLNIKIIKTYRDRLH